MPGFDGTGPMGRGPMTGGARGRCTPAASGYTPLPTASVGYGGGRGYGRRRGFGAPGMGRFYGGGYWPPVYGPGMASAPADELSMLKASAEYLQNSLDGINRRIQALEKDTGE